MPVNSTQVRSPFQFSERFDIQVYSLLDKEATSSSPSHRLAPPRQQSSQPPSLPAVSNPYGSDLHTAYKIESSEADDGSDEELDLAGEFSHCDDDSEKLLQDSRNVNSDVEVNAQFARSSKPSWLSVEYSIHAMNGIFFTFTRNRLLCLPLRQASQTFWVFVSG